MGYVGLIWESRVEVFVSPPHRGCAVPAPLSGGRPKWLFRGVRPSVHWIKYRPRSLQR